MYARRSYVEKRDFIRMTMQCPMSYQLLESMNQKSGTCINLSANGLLFQCDDNFPPGTLVKVSVSPSLSISPPFNAIVRIVRAKSHTAGDGFLLAGIIQEVN